MLYLPHVHELAALFNTWLLPPADRVAPAEESRTESFVPAQ